MNTRSFLASTLPLVAALMTAGAVLGNAAPAHAAWQHAHGDSDNAGFAPVNTVAASQPINGTFLGRVAPGANPVIGSDGTVYIGNMTGELQAFRPDGTPYWKRQVNPEHGSFYASPVIGADGSIYIVSTKPRADGLRGDSYLHKFLPGGGWLGGRSFPFHGGDGGATSAPPNIWRHNGQEAIIVPAQFSTYNGVERRLIAFSTQQNVMSDVLVGFESFGDIGGGGVGKWGQWSLAGCLALHWWNLGLGCALFGPPGFDAPSGSSPIPNQTAVDKAGYPMAGVAIVKPRQAGAAPTIVVTDEDYVVGYSFSMTAGLSAIHHYDYNRGLATPPITLPDGTTVVGSLDGHVFYEKAGSYLGFSGPFGTLTAAPTRLFGGAIATLNRGGYLTLSKGGSILYQRQMTGGPTIASVAASCTHFYVSTQREFVTYDAKDLRVVGRYYWQAPYVEAGLHAPVIGPTGYVYAVVRYSQSNAEGLYVFPRPAAGGSESQACSTS